MKRRGRGEPVVPDWVRAAGFVPAAWAEPGDFDPQVDPEVAEREAEGRWIRARLVYFEQNPAAADIVMAELQSWVRDTD